MFKVKSQRSKPQLQLNVSAETGTDRLSDFKLGMGVVTKADEDGGGVERPQVAMQSQLPHFIVESCCT